MKLLSSLLLILALFAGILPAQNTPPAQASAWDAIKDPGNIAMVAFVAANVADAKTDWRFTGPVTQREYVITPAQRLGIAGGSVMAALAMKHLWPKAGKAVDVAVGMATAYFAGRALANTYAHGAPDAAPAARARSSPAAFAVRLQLGRR
ncbi:MAG: hypothetical protein LAQ30_01590 [Acidobacteriia bacterium]|nr:hypothetical protein [Terriglobia bacterium]